VSLFVFPSIYMQRRAPNHSSAASQSWYVQRGKEQKKKLHVPSPPSSGELLPVDRQAHRKDLNDLWARGDEALPLVDLPMPRALGVLAQKAQM
jgi:hypothetical protein